jgi:hypothetical protein
MMRLAAQAPCRFRPLSSNVRQQRAPFLVRHRWRAPQGAAKARLRVRLVVQVFGTQLFASFHLPGPEALRG